MVPYGQVLRNNCSSIEKTVVKSPIQILSAASQSESGRWAVHTHTLSFLYFCDVVIHGPRNSEYSIRNLWYWTVLCCIVLVTVSMTRQLLFNQWVLPESEIIFPESFIGHHFCLQWSVLRRALWQPTHRN